MNYKRYSKKSDYSFSFGVYPTIKLIENKPDKVIKIITKSNSLENAGVKKLISLAESQNFNVGTNDRLIEKLSGKGNIYALGIFSKYECEINTNSNHVVLVNPADSGNLGTIIRTMTGFSVFDLAVIRPAVDIFLPEVIRSSMGSIFQINFEYFDSFEVYRNKFPASHFYPFMTSGSESLEDCKFTKPWSIIFGNEASGLSDDFLTLGQSVKIRQSEFIDSFNLAISTGIALYQASIVNNSDSQ